ncbi:transcription termination/antitermination NusG family protein [Lichenibacterium ramalinae]|nr:transcription termination/antitermination NusG family protein [Lichenibacterium ramalinae]
MDLGDDRPRRWFAVRVAPQSESAVMAALADAGLSGWAPMSTRWRGSAAGRQKMTAPAFPTYVFAALPEPVANHFGIVVGLRGVRGFLGGARPEPVSAVAVSLLQMRERFGHFDETRTRPPRTVHETPADRRIVDRLVAHLNPKAVAA